MNDTSGSEYVTSEDDVISWQKATFPGSPDERLVAHLREEVDELFQAIEDRGNVGEEIADCVLLMIVLAGRFGTSVHDEVQRKFLEIQGRTYRYDERVGYERHVE